MINIYLSSRSGININTFFEKFNKEFLKRNINFNSSLEDCSIVFYMFNLGIKNLFKDKNMWLKRKYDNHKEIDNILSYIKMKKKLIIYVRKDGSGIIGSILKLINEHPNSILFVIKDFLLKEEKNYPLLVDSHYKYLISKIFPKKDKIIKYSDYYNDLNKWYCYTIPYCKNIPYTFLKNRSKFNENKNEKNIDVFYVKTYRDNTYNSIYRRKLFEKLKAINKNNKFKLYTDSCDKNTFYTKLNQSKIMISVWGIGESIKDDYYCLMNDIIVLRVNTSHVKDFYNLYEKNNIFYFFEVDFSNLEKKIDYILKNYNECYKLYNKNRKKLVIKYSPINHVNILTKKIKKSRIKLKEDILNEEIKKKRLEQERLEQERLEQERLEQERLENEKLEQEKLEKEKLEQEKLEKEKLLEIKLLNNYKLVDLKNILKKMEIKIFSHLNKKEIIKKLVENNIYAEYKIKYGN